MTGWKAIIPTDNHNQERETLKKLSSEKLINRDEVENFMKTLNDKKYVETIINILEADKFKIHPSEYVYAKTAQEVGLGESRFELARIMEVKRQNRYGR